MYNVFIIFLSFPLLCAFQRKSRLYRFSVCRKRITNLTWNRKFNILEICFNEKSFRNNHFMMFVQQLSVCFLLRSSLYFLNSRAFLKNKNKTLCACFVLLKHSSHSLTVYPLLSLIGITLFKAVNTPINKGLQRVE